MEDTGRPAEDRNADLHHPRRAVAQPEPLQPPGVETPLRAADVATMRDNGMHALRHFYASVLLDAGENIKALSEYLGHHDPGFTLRTYTHLMPASKTGLRI